MDKLKREQTRVAVKMLSNIFMLSTETIQGAPQYPDFSSPSEKKRHP